MLPCIFHLFTDAAQVDSALAVVRGVLAGKSLGDALVATRQHSASEYQYQFVKARNDYLQQARPAPRPQGLSWVHKSLVCALHCALHALVVRD